MVGVEKIVAVAERVVRIIPDPAWWTKIQPTKAFFLKRPYISYCLYLPCGEWMMGAGWVSGALWIRVLVIILCVNFTSDNGAYITSPPSRIAIMRLNTGMKR